MATNATPELERSGTTDASYTYHIESPEVGGAKYVRCTGCGRECVPADPDRLAHRDGCPNQ